MPKTEILRHPERALTERGEIEAILDEALVAHVGFVDDGAPVVIPTTFARVGGTMYIHGAVKGRLGNSLANADQICVTVTLLDGLVLAKSAFHHSMNYRSAVVFGKPRLVVDPSEKRTAFDALVEHVVPGRSRDARGASETELLATIVIALGLDHCSAKRRIGPPVDASADAQSPIWTGVIPCRLSFDAPEAIDDPSAGETPGYVRDYARG